MTNHFRPLSQPFIATIVLAITGITVAESWLLSPEGVRIDLQWANHVLLAAALVAGLLLAKQYPVHIRYITKIEMGTVPLFLTAALFPPGVAPGIAFAGIMLAEASWRKHSGLYLTDMLTQAGRMSLAVFLASALTHISVHHLVVHGLLLAGAATAMWTADLLSTPLLIVPITGERPTRIVREVVIGVGLPEAGQYLLALLGVGLAGIDPWATTLLILPIALLYKVSKRAKELHESTRLFLENLADSVDSRDPFTHEHSKRVTVWTQELLRELGVVNQEAHLITTAARLHDIGKISLPDEILHKHGQLSPDEWAVMEQHPVIGADTLTRSTGGSVPGAGGSVPGAGGSVPGAGGSVPGAFAKSFARGAAIVRGHHERWDGKGYPDRLAGPDIPFGARVIAVVDSFDAMTSDRPYRKGMSWERAAGILSAGRGTQWDPEVVSAFLRVLAPRLADKQVGEGAGELLVVSR
jgi:HD-GYP domain-containing protein (c-di-GMP phosphodiesterase class II)